MDSNVPGGAMSLNTLIMKKILFFASILILLFQINGQTQNLSNHTQTVKGTVIDKDSQIPLIGANIVIRSIDPFMGSTTDVDGYFRIEDVPTGRLQIEITYLGYEPQFISQVLLTSGKELVINVGLIESVESLDEVVVTAKIDKTKPLNEMASASARTFSVEESARYAAASFDPARMAMNYAGVSVGATDDLFNQIVIRGNSPKGLLWRLEGIEIPSPNHFGGLGGGGGAISMLSSSTLSNSDFYTGAFPAEYGNAVSGVFDLKMRNGNNEKREYSFMLGALGLELAAEGPFKKGGKGSYLVNYRYSTLAALEAVGLNPAGDVLPAYQDISFKLNMPTEKFGNFGLFGLGGYNEATGVAVADSTKWEDDNDMYNFIESERRYVLGLSHNYLLSDNSYLKTQISASGYYQVDDERFLDANNDYAEVIDYSDEAADNALRLSAQYNKKINAQNTFRAGIILSQMDFFFNASERDEEQNDKLVTFFDKAGATGFYQAYGQWQHRTTSNFTLNGGLHYSHFELNGNFAIEPRLGLKWDFKSNQSLSAAVGLHSKLEHLILYMGEGELVDGTQIIKSDNLELNKSAQAVIGYDIKPAENLRIKAEAYYQYLYDIPTETNVDTKYNLLVAEDAWDYVRHDTLASIGRGQNVGLDLTVEKFFAKQHYYMITASIFDSKYSPADKKWYNTRWNSGYQLNLVGGKEFNVGKKGNKTLGINGKFVTSGGNRQTPVDFEASRLEGEQIRIHERAFEERAGSYFRFDLGFSYKINLKGSTHSIMLDVQNVTARENLYGTYYNNDCNCIEKITQTGLFPFFNYRIEF